MAARRKKPSRLRRTVRALLVVVLIVVAGGWALGCFSFSSEPYTGPVTDHFDGNVFHNQMPVERDRNRKGGFWKWMFSRDPGVWEEWTDATPGPPPPERVPRGEMRVTFVNHATALVQMDDLNILTDPVWAKRIGPVPWLAGPKRHRPPRHPLRGVTADRHRARQPQPLRPPRPADDPAADRPGRSALLHGAG